MAPYEPVVILVKATQGPGPYFNGFYAIYPEARQLVLGNISDGIVVRYHYDKAMQFECVWRLTAPPGTRIQTSVEQFRGGGVVLKEGNGVDVVDIFPILVMNPSLGYISSPFKALSSEQQVWLTLGLSRSNGYLYELKAVFTAYNVTGKFIVLICSKKVECRGVGYIKDVF